MLHQTNGFYANALLGSLTDDSLRALAPHLELVKIKSAQLLCETDEPMRHLYFPTTSMMSVLYLMEDGAMVEVAAVGSEGAVGVSSLADYGCGATVGRIEVRSGGYAYRVPTQVFRREFDRSVDTFQLMLRYWRVAMAQIARSALCNRHHSVSEQLSRWLLLAHDRVEGDELAVTQQTIANMLGVRREGITEAAGKLQEAGLIRQRRGHITVLDRQGLEAHACECYGMIRAEFNRLVADAKQDADRAIPAEGRPLRVAGYPEMARSAA
ncbi:Crp/Fnr family transcriptional regulator [Burkholderia sp. TSV86]|uniref:Crp/Fnr family transcriptional regulator n=1 Tax=Burkholderia sp. TSV86 TaxID=1385594 RepID=UPI00075F59E8|nr:Crp/Fnr family transcriptional regulator [Burkholderia sp. TSV86]KVE38718.1 Crp/Fnr family transcriptional regulator [Burkholderia sp. TSV86]